MLPYLPYNPNGPLTPDGYTYVYLILVLESDRAVLLDRQYTVLEEVGPEVWLPLLQQSTVAQVWEGYVVTSGLNSWTGRAMWLSGAWDPDRQLQVVLSQDIHGAVALVNLTFGVRSEAERVHAAIRDTRAKAQKVMTLYTAVPGRTVSLYWDAWHSEFTLPTGVDATAAPSRKRILSDLGLLPREVLFRPGMPCSVYANQAYRPGVVLATRLKTHRSRGAEWSILVEYVMPEGSTALREVPMGDNYVRPRIDGGKSLSYFKVPLPWLQAIAAAGMAWQGRPQQAGGRPAPSVADLLTQALAASTPVAPTAPESPTATLEGA